MSKVILWDWDNTLADTFGAIFAAQNDLRAHYGLPPWTLAESKQAMNASGRNIIRDMLGEDKAPQARAYYLKRYAAHAAELKLKPGAVEILQFARKKGYVSILASNKTGDILRNEAQAMGVAELFDRIVGAQDVAEDKPSPAFTEATLAGRQAARLISIGDGKSDIQMARNYPNGIGILIGNPALPEFRELQPDRAYPDLIALRAFFRESLSKIRQEKACKFQRNRV